MKFVQTSVIEEHIHALEEVADLVSVKKKQEIADVLVDVMLILDEKCQELAAGIYNPCMVVEEDEENDNQ